SRRTASPKPGSATRPGDPLGARGHRAHSLVDELLHAFAFVGLRRVDVALGIGGDAVHAEELSRLPAAVAEVRDLLQRFANDDADLLVGAVGEEDEALLRVLRERD